MIPQDTFFRITTAKGFGCYVMFLVVDSSSGFEFQFFPGIQVSHKTWLNTVETIKKCEKILFIIIIYFLKASFCYFYVVIL